MALFLGIIIFTFLLTGLAIIPFINLLYKIKFQRRDQKTLDFQGERLHLFDKYHRVKVGTPVGGGFLIILVVSLLYAVFFPIISRLGFYVSAFYPIKDELNILFFTFISFGLLGLYDDLMKFFGLASQGIFGLRLRHKFILQWILALTIAVMLYQNLKISFVNVPFWEIIRLDWLYIPVAAFIIVTFTNAFNITDGLDGLAGGLLLISLTAFWILAGNNLDTVLAIFLSFWIGALVAFLYFNVYPARIFMGDVGALSFGATLAVVGLLIGKIVALTVIGGLFLFEGFTSLVQIMAIRFLGRRILTAAPFHLWLQHLGWEEPKIVMRAWLAALMLAILGLWFAFI